MSYVLYGGDKDGTGMKNMGSAMLRDAQKKTKNWSKYIQKLLLRSMFGVILASFAALYDALLPKVAKIWERWKVGNT